MSTEQPSTVGSWIALVGLCSFLFLIMGGGDLFDELATAARVMLLTMATTLIGVVIQIAAVIARRFR